MAAFINTACILFVARIETSLHVLSLGGNLLTEVPDTVGNLHHLQGLTLCDNLIEMLPAGIARLTNLKSLLLHRNRLRHLPRDIITLKNLVEVSETGTHSDFICLSITAHVHRGRETHLRWLVRVCLCVCVSTRTLKKNTRTHR